jgi:hypothetical protein
VVAATLYSRIRRPRGLSRFVALFAVLAFAFQSFIVQTHIHGTSLGFSAPTLAKTLGGKGNGKLPADNPLDCPFCQAVAHAGAFYAPATPLLIVPFVLMRGAVLRSALRSFVSAAPISWNSRAPPLR